MRVILDTDMGMGVPGTEIDDGFALALLLASPALELELVASVNGNIDGESATYLSVGMLERLGREDIPVFAGARAPIVEPDRLREAPTEIRDEFHRHQPAPGFAAAEIAQRVLASPGEITIIAIGPLTNIALAIALDHRVATAAKEIVIMGGVFLGHTNQARMPGEFNWWVDPHAARAVMHSGATIRLVGLDVTNQVRLTREHAHEMSASDRAFSRFAGECTLTWLDRLARENPGAPEAGESCGMHDPLAVAAITDPDLLTWSPAHVDVITDHAAGRGMAVCDFLTSVDAPPANCTVATDVDAEKFMAHFLGHITDYN